MSSGGWEVGTGGETRREGERERGGGGSWRASVNTSCTGGKGEAEEEGRKRWQRVCGAGGRALGGTRSHGWLGWVLGARWHTLHTHCTLHSERSLRLLQCSGGRGNVRQAPSRACFLSSAMLCMLCSALRLCACAARLPGLPGLPSLPSLLQSPLGRLHTTTYPGKYLACMATR